jgi:glycosyltransferase involved in cell wall biosynthesis
MALGAPIVALDTVYNREVLGPDHARFVTPDPTIIAAAIAELASDPAAQTTASKAGIARANTEYTWPDVSARYEAVLRKLLNRGHVGRVSE